MLPRTSDLSLTELFSLRGRGAVVTGAARGIGRAICTRLAEGGADVLASDVDEVALARLREDTGVRVVAADASRSESVRALATEATSSVGEVSIWVNNVGAYPARNIVDVSDDDWRSIVDVNLTSAFLGSRAAAELMVPRGRGVIVNIASDLGMRAAPGLGHYAATKHGVIGLTRGLALELAPHGIRALAVAPGFVVTEGSSGSAIVTDPDRRTRAEAEVPAGRFGEPDDIARVVVFAVSDLAAFMTGSVLTVDGGVLAGPAQRS
jgi:NAD(P)-dependent dehydrogenase (short-subunit alcohol dehydrogenase family)